MSDFEASVEKLVVLDPRYPREAYLYLRSALDHTQALYNRTGHVSVTELLEGIREYTLKEYGPMSELLLEEWGIRSCADLGELVFNLIEAGELRKTDQDRREDFAAGYSFFDAFRKPFLPAEARSPAPDRAG
jgi:uncharacterized repeat protein (TIGR04138 family)